MCAWSGHARSSCWSSSPVRILRAEYDADTKAAWTFSSKSLETMHRECRARGVPLVLMVVPMEAAFDERSTATTRVWNVTKASAEKPHGVLAEFCAKQGIALLDLLPGFRASAVRPLHVEEGHWNVAGNRLAAELACAMLARPGLPARWRDLFAEQLAHGDREAGERDRCGRRETDPSPSSRGALRE